MSPNKNYIGGGLVAVAIVLFWALALPLYNSVSDLDTAIQDRSELLASRNTIVTNINSLDKEYQKRVTEITKLSAIVPAKKSIAEVLSAIDNISTRNGIQLINSAIIGHATSDNTNPYNTLSLDMSLTGTYPALINLLGAFEKNLRLMDITSIAAAATTPTNPILNFTVKGDAYYLK